MEFDLASYERAAAGAQPWPTAFVSPPLPVLDRGDLRDLLEGDELADQVEACTATAAGARGALETAATPLEAATYLAAVLKLAGGDHQESSTRTHKATRRPPAAV